MLLSGTRIFNNRYTIIERVSQGGFADVYRVREFGSANDIAIKIDLDPQTGQFASEALRAEAKILSRIKHRNIVRILPIFRQADKPDVYYARLSELEGNPYFFVMEYLAGDTLGDYLNSVRILPEAEAAAIGVQIARAIDYLHLRGYAHNDLKLENIVFRHAIETGSLYDPVLIDFGIATRVHLPQAVSLYVGPPELLKNLRMESTSEFKQDVDRTKVDSWGLGVVLYRMVGGELPFAGSSRRRITDRIINDRPTSLKELSSEVSPDFEELIIDGCLAKDPRNRLSILEVGVALANIGEGVVASSSGTKKPSGFLRWMFGRLTS